MLVQDTLVLARSVGDDLLPANLPLEASLHELRDLRDLAVRRVKGLLYEFLAVFSTVRVEVPDAFLLVSREGLISFLELVLDPKHHPNSLLVGVRIKTLGFLDHLAVEHAVLYVALFLAVEDFLHQLLPGPEEVKPVEVVPLELGKGPNVKKVVESCTFKGDFKTVKQAHAAPSESLRGFEKGLEVLNDTILEVPGAVDLVHEVLQLCAAYRLILQLVGLLETQAIPRVRRRVLEERLSLVVVRHRDDLDVGGDEYGS